MQGDWLGQWPGAWFGDAAEQPEGSIAGNASITVSLAGDLTATGGSVVGSAAISFTVAGTLTNGAQVESSGGGASVKSDAFATAPRIKRKKADQPQAIASEEFPDIASRLAEEQRQEAAELARLRAELAEATAQRDALAVEIAESVIDKAKEQAKATDKRNRAALLAWMLLR